MAIHSISGYQLEEVLGQGPHGTVYKARGGTPESRVAVKLFDMAAEIDYGGKLLRLTHPHIALVLEIKPTGPTPFAVTEYLSGGTLKEHIRSTTSVGEVFPFLQVLAYAEQIGAALKHAHAGGIVHGNLKPENVMFDSNGVLKLTDFATANATSSDLVGFGRIVYEMLT